MHFTSPLNYGQKRVKEHERDSRVRPSAGWLPLTGHASAQGLEAGLAQSEELVV